MPCVAVRADYEYVGQKKRAARVGFHVLAVKVPDVRLPLGTAEHFARALTCAVRCRVRCVVRCAAQNVGLLRSLRDEGLVVSTPGQDYDDSYTVQYAVKHSAFVVSNDKFRDHI